MIPPTLATNNFADGGLTHAKFIGQCLLREASGAVSITNDRDIIESQYCSGIPFSNRGGAGESPSVVSSFGHHVSRVGATGTQEQMSSTGEQDAIDLVNTLGVISTATRSVAGMQYKTVICDWAIRHFPCKAMGAHNTPVYADAAVAPVVDASRPEPTVRLSISVKSSEKSRMGNVALSESTIMPEYETGTNGNAAFAAAPTATADTIFLHRDLPLTRNRGAAPGAVTSSDRATSRLDFTMFLRVMEG